MPIIASAIINIKINTDKTIEVLKTEFSKCACFKSSDLAIKTGIDITELTESLKILSNKGEIHCDDKYSLCCQDMDKLKSFSEKLKKIKSVGG